ncbi:MAG: peptide deformylase [Bacilli bacterium]|nr:peptide deformylase [Bacilli bacterium]
METLKIIKDNNPLLRKKSVEVSMPLSKEDKDTLLNMLNYLKNSQDEKYREKHPEVKEGIGLAAPQIGILKRMLVVYFKREDEEVTHVLVNPTIISNSARKCVLSAGEGCLSVDNKHEGVVYRDYKIKVKAYDALLNKDVTITAIGLESIVLQHEIDHLSGILYYDRINKMNPNFIPEGFVEI